MKQTAPTVQLTKKLPLAELDLLILPLFAEENFINSTKPYLSDPQLIETLATDFKNKPGSTYVVYPPSGQGKRLMLLGLGKKAELNTLRLRQVLQAGFLAAQNLKIKQAGLVLPRFHQKLLPQYLELAALTLVFASYKFDAYKHQQEAGAPVLETVLIQTPSTVQAEQAIKQGLMIGQAVNAARSLGNHPGNIATPTHLAQHALASAKKFGFKARVLGRTAIQREGLGLLLGVSQGSEEEPKFIILETGPKNLEPIVFIGKGLTFDSGGVSIKPSERLEEMKYDMCGGATVIGTLEAAAQLKLPLHLIGLIPSTENLLSGKAVKPGDILTAHAGKSVEVINTDAEGRLVLADAISYAKKYYKPKLIVDYATLTGAVMIALGSEYAGYFSNQAKYDSMFKEAAKRSGEQFWALPLAAEYQEELKSQVADIKNLGEKMSAGATTAALFLQYFVGQTPWVHFDIAGTAWSVKPKAHLPLGATGYGVYLTIQFLRQLALKK